MAKSVLRMILHSWQKRLLPFFLFLVIYLPSQAQVELIAPKINADNGEIITVDIKTANFEEILSVQFTLSWDSTIVTYLGVGDEYGLPQSNEDNIGASNAGSGNLAFGWLDNSLNGVSVEDSTILFSAQFRVIGMAGDSTALQFTENVASIEVVAAANTSEPAEVSLNHGSVRVNGIIDGINDVFNPIFSLSQNFPNPFKETTIISTNFVEPTPAHFTIYSSNGHIIFQKHYKFKTGEHSIEIDKSIFSESGTYWYQIQTPTYTINKSLIFFN